EDAVDAVRPPDSQQAEDAAAADVDQILGEQVRAQVAGALLAPEERDVAGLAAVGAEGAVEADHVVVGVTARRRQEADARPWRLAEPQHVVVEQGIARLHRETATAEGDDLAPVALHPVMVAAEPSDVLMQPVGSLAARNRPFVQSGAP